MEGLSLIPGDTASKWGESGSKASTPGVPSLPYLVHWPGWCMPGIHLTNRDTGSQPGMAPGLGDGEIRRYRHRPCHPGAPVLILRRGVQ